jgi:nitroreductase
MNLTVSEAVKLRKSTRGFLRKPISNKLIKNLLIKAAQAPSGGNLQPWRIYILNKKSMSSFMSFQKTWAHSSEPAYEIYPAKLKEPYRTDRFEVGEEMYSLLGISRDDKDARIQQVMKNFDFFDAPAALFCFIDKQMGPPQWSDLGMFLQTFMLLAQEVGLATCAQEAWSLKHECVKHFVKADDDLMLFCGMAIGFQDINNPINKLKTTRQPLDAWAKFI